MRKTGLTLTSLLLLAACLALTSCFNSAQSPRALRQAITQSQEVLADFRETELSLSPETANALGLEATRPEGFTYQLDNHSQIGFERSRLIHIELLQRLQRRPYLPADHPLERTLRVGEQTLERLITLEQAGFGRLSLRGARPYAIDPYSGVWTDGLDLLLKRHAVDKESDVNAYLARLEALAQAVDDTRRRLLADQSTGIILPRALLSETALRVRAVSNDEAAGLGRLASLIDDLALDVEYLTAEDRANIREAAELLVETQVRPAYLALAETIEGLTYEAQMQPGVWAQPQSLNVYPELLAFTTGERPDLDRLLENALGDTAILKAELVARLNPVEEDAPIQPLSDRIMQDWTRLETARLAIENAGRSDAAALSELAEMTPVSLWPASLEQAYKALRSLPDEALYSEWLIDVERRDYTLHDLIPFRALMQGAWLYFWSERRSTDEPEITAQSLAALHGELLHFALAATDLGLHHARWSEETAKAYLIEEAGLSEPLARDQMLRLSAAPGDAAATYLTYRRLRSLSERAQAVLGARYAERDFQRVIIINGPRPLSMIETDIEAWYADQIDPSGG